MQPAKAISLWGALILVLSACETRNPHPPQTVQRPVPAAIASDLPAAFHSGKLAEMDAAIQQAIADKKCPGGVLWLERNGGSYHKAYGRRALVPAEEPMTEDTIFDAASVTKVVACTPAIMLLIERGQIKLDERVQKYIPEFAGGGKDPITIRQLLTHTSGLQPDLSRNPDWTGYDTAIRMACAERVLTPPGTAFRYSDINFFLLGEVVVRVSGIRLNEFVAREVYGPLRMVDTGFLPPITQLPRIAPTETSNREVSRGTVHDPTARRMAGVAGHAGLFTTAADLARYARMLLNLGELDGVRVFRPETVQLMTRVQSPANVPARRGLGWDIDSPYSGPRGKYFPIGSYGHTGWTGTSLWLDPFSKTFVIFLSNRNHPDERGSVIALRSQLGTLAAEAVPDFNFVYVPGALSPRADAAASVRGPRREETAEVLNGIDVLARQKFAPLKGLRVGLITNHTGHDRQRNPTIDLLQHAPGVELKALFSPEHGIRGALDEKVNDSIDEKTGLPIFSLYGERRQPGPGQLQGLDALVFDLQDIGCRFYTYVSTMGLAMQAAAEAKIRFIVLDRVNPINGIALEGPVHRGASGFTAFHSIPLRYGMTIGELARMFNAERGFNADLSVIQLEGWKRAFWCDQTGLPWTNPSPNMRNLAEAILYPGVGLLETAVSVGRGTDTPFEVIGAPYIDDRKLAAELNRGDLAAVRFVPVRFTPKSSVFKDKLCGGVYLLVTDRDALNAVDVGLTLVLTLQRLYPADFPLEKVQTLLQHRPTIDAIKSGKTLAEIKQLWSGDLDQFKKRREKFLIYQ
jgi:uncharacterized protein YbbC (DUF1343 family)/CubicO group peptidase (beta-lactamase class C family)